MLPRTIIQLKKQAEARVLKGHPWVYSNEINTKATSIKSIKPGSEVLVMHSSQKPLAIGYINPHSLIVIRIMSSKASNLLDIPFFVERLVNAYLIRNRLIKAPYFRLVYGEADYLPGLIIDRYQSHLVLQINTAGMEAKRDLIKDALLQAFPWIQSIYVRNDTASRKVEGLSSENLSLYGTVPQRVALLENDCQFLVPLTTGQKTGWFYDHRANRNRLNKYVHDTRVLDVFSYLGAWGIHAAVAGAKSVDCIEVSSPACDFILQNAKLNHVNNKIKIINEDVFVAFKHLLYEHREYDVIILDPPAFIKKRKDRDQGLIAYYRLQVAALKLLAKDGILITCSCSMHLSDNDLILLVQRAAVKIKCQVQILEKGHQCLDHPIHPLLAESNYLKAIWFRKSL